MVFRTRPDQNPGTVIVDRVTRKLLGRFQDGLYETDDPKMIARMKPHYDVVEEEKKGRTKRCRQTDQEV